MPDNVTFDGTSNSPTANTVVATDYAPTANGSAHYQRFKLDIGPDGSTIPVGYGGTGMPLGTLPGGTVQTHGTSQVLGTVQPLAGSVHLASGTVSVLGTVQTHGTSQALGTVQSLAGSVHVAAPITGTLQVHGTVPVGTIAGTVSVLGTVRILDPAAVTQSGAWSVAVLGTVQTHGTSQVLGTIQPLAGSVHVAAPITGTIQVHGTVPVGTVAGTVSVLGTIQPLAGSVHVANPISGTVQTHGTSQVLGTLQPLAGSVHLATSLPGGTIVAVGSALHGAAADARPLLFAAFGSSGTQAAVDDGDAVRLWADLNGRLQIRGTIDSMPAVNVATGTIPGGTVQLHGTSEILGTVRALTTVNVTVGTIAEGTINSFTGTAQVLGTVRTLAGTAQVQGFIGAGTLAAGNPISVGAIGSSGTLAAVGDGSTQYLWSDLSGRLQIRGTIDSMPAITGTVQPLAGSVHVANTISGTVQVHGTVPVGTVAGTVSVLGTLQPLAGSVHLATNLAGGTVVSVGSAAHDAAADTRPHLIGAFGSSGTQDAVGNGDAVRLWADLNGRLQVRGTIDSIPAITITAGTVSLQTGGTIHVGSVQSVAGTVQVLGSVQAVGTVNLGTVQGTVQVRPAGVVGESFIGTIFTGAAFSTAAVLVNPASGTFVRLFDVLISGSAAGTVRLEFGSASGTLIAPLFLAANGGWSMNSTRGVRSPGTSKGLYVTASAGTWGVMINYALEN